MPQIDDCIKQNSAYGNVYIIKRKSAHAKRNLKKTRDEEPHGSSSLCYQFNSDLPLADQDRSQRRKTHQRRHGKAHGGTVRGGGVAHRPCGEQGKGNRLGGSDTLSGDPIIPARAVFLEYVLVCGQIFGEIGFQESQLILHTK